jgi:hypothetical protein
LLNHDKKICRSLTVVDQTCILVKLFGDKSCKS